MKISNDAQAVIYKQQNKNISFLLLYRHNPEKESYEYRLVKGGIKKGETIENAVKREIEEEIGLKNIEIISKIHEYSYIVNKIRHNVHTFLIKALDTDININSSKEGKFEIKKARWASAQDTINLLSFDDEKKSIINSLKKINS